MKPVWVFLSLKSTSHFLPQSIVSCRSDSRSEARCCHRSDAWSYLEKWVVSSWQIAILQKTSSRRWLIGSRKGVGPRMEPWGTPALTGYSCNNFKSRTTQSHLLLRKKWPNIWPETPQEFSLWRRPACQTLLKDLEYNSSSLNNSVSPRLVKDRAILSDETEDLQLIKKT